MATNRLFNGFWVAFAEKATATERSKWLIINAIHFAGSLR